MPKLGRTAVVGLFVITGCVSVSKSVVSRDYMARPIPPEEVYVISGLAGEVVPESCAKVAILHASGAELATEAKMVDKLRTEAGKLGANAVFIGGVEEPGTGERLAAAFLGTGTDKDQDAVAYHCNPDDLK